MARGDERIFMELVAPLLGDGFRLARWLTGDASVAEDVVQEAALRAWRSIGERRDAGARAWFLAIVRNVAFTWVRKNRRADHDGGEAAAFRLEAEPAPGPSPEAALIAKADAEIVRIAVAALPDALRETLVLREISGLTYREIASATVAPIGTVMSRLARARQLLALALAGKGGR
jgi:RNA polymerase sigma-70 factor (ECF subfamily)